MKRLCPLMFLFVVSLVSCNIPSAEVRASATADFAASATPTRETPSATHTRLPTETLTATFTLTPTETLMPAPSLTPTVTATPTYAFPTVTVNKQAHCRYGPSVAYLHAADLYAGDIGTVRGRFRYSSWLYVKFDKLNYSCWVAPSVVNVVGDVSLIAYRELNLQAIGTNMYGPPKNVYAVRDGNKVTIYWDQVVMTKDDDRGYLIEAFVCQDDAYLWWTFSYPDQFTTSYTVKDEAGCPFPSQGVIYTVEKHGFSQPAVIPWPAP
jgi:hypothetical protein